MFLLSFFRYLRGYVLFEARGVFAERFLNLLARDRIAVWSGRKRDEVYTGCVAARDYPRLRAHAKKTGVRLRIQEKHGERFQRQKYRKRYGLAVGMLLFVMFVSCMSRFIWRIEIAGNEKSDDVAILQALESLGVSPGTPRSRIDVRDCERKILLLVPDLSWAALNIEGSVIHVEVSESIPPPEMIDPKTACNVVAKEAGQIVAMNVFEGQALVAVGDTVLPGDIIVSGITQDAHGQSLYRHARAEVFAETPQVLEITVPLTQTAFTETGEVRKRGTLDVLGIELPLFLPFRIPSPYRVERTETQFSLFSVQLPLFWLSERYVLMEESPLLLTEEEAKQEAMRELSNLQKTRLEKSEILEKKVTGQMSNHSFAIRAEYICRMDIAMEKEIFTESPPTA